MPSLFPSSMLWLTALCLTCFTRAGAQTGQSVAAQIQTSPAPPTATPADVDQDDPPPPPVASQVRIVRLSQVRGKATIERSPNGGFAPAFANIPIVTGARLRTQEGVAEVEFEDGSTLRVTPNSEIDFTQLGRTSAGATVSEQILVTGSVYVSLARTPAHNAENLFLLATGKDTLRLTPGSHIRLDVDEPAGNLPNALGTAPDSTAGTSLVQAVDTALSSSATNATLVVFDGEVDFASPVGHTTVTRKRTLTFNTGNGAPPVVESRVLAAPFDQWDKEGIQYQKRYLNASAFAGSGYVYGASDLNYYGSFSNLAGCGSVWRPYFASAAWDPYDNGIWASYGSAGYSWVSPYPWGWLPFHTGSWQFCGNGGWGWRPGGAFYGVYNHPRLFRSTVYGVNHPPRPPHVPTGGQPRLVPVNVHPLAPSGLTSTGDFNFRKDSAGFGVPREGFHHLGHESAVLDHKGVARTDLDLGRFALPSSNRVPPGMPASAWRNQPGNGSAADRAAWAAARGVNGSSGSARPGEAVQASGPRWNPPAGARSGAPSPTWQSGGQRGGQAAGSAPSARGYSGGSGSPSFHSAPAASAPSFHSAPAAAPSAGVAPHK